MPDITMCAAEGCLLSRHCYRHQDSGTVPSDFRQAYSAFRAHTEFHHCASYWPVREKGDE